MRAFLEDHDDAKRFQFFGKHNGGAIVNHAPGRISTPGTRNVANGTRPLNKRINVQSFGIVKESVQCLDKTRSAATRAQESTRMLVKRIHECDGIGCNRIASTATRCVNECAPRKSVENVGCFQRSYETLIPIGRDGSQRQYIVALSDFCCDQLHDFQGKVGNLHGITRRTTVKKTGLIKSLNPMNPKAVEFVLDQIRCCICLEPCIDNLMQCYNGHPHCRDCLRRLPIPPYSTRRRCSMCMSSNGWTKQRAMTQMIQHFDIRIPCEHQGCGVLVSSEEFSEHKKTCKHRMYSCPLFPNECDLMKFSSLQSHIQNHGKRLFHTLPADSNDASAPVSSKYLNIVRSNIPESSGRIVLNFDSHLFVMDISGLEVRLKTPHRNPDVRLIGYGPTPEVDTSFQVEFVIPDLLGHGWSRSLCDIEFSQALLTLEDTDYFIHLHTFPKHYATGDVTDRCWAASQPITVMDLKAFGVGKNLEEEDDEAWTLFAFSIRLHRKKSHSS